MTSRAPTFNDLEKVSRASYISEVMPYVRTELEAMISSVQAQVFAKMRDGKYTMQDGDNAWREIYAYDRLLRRLETTVRIGQHVGGQVAEHMKIGDTNG